MQLKNQAVLITGTDNGIGLGIAERFAAEGAVVVLVDHDATRGEALHLVSNEASAITGSIVIADAGAMLS